MIRYEDIVQTVCEELGYTVEWWEGIRNRRFREVSHVTRIIAYVCCIRARLTHERTGALIGKNQSTIAFYVQRETDEMNIYPDERRMMERIINAINDKTN